MYSEGFYLSFPLRSRLTETLACDAMSKCGVGRDRKSATHPFSHIRGAVQNELFFRTRDHRRRVFVQIDGACTAVVVDCIHIGIAVYRIIGVTL